MSEGPDVDGAAAFGKGVDFGKTASDYAKYRAGFPDAFFARLTRSIAIEPGAAALDLGTGTGTVARGLARIGMKVTGIDPAEALMQEAAEIDRGEGISITYREGRAEALDFTDRSFDIVTAGQCWHWFDRDRAAAEAFRVLRPGGAIVIAHFDWLPLRGNMVEATEQLIVEANPAWKLGGATGLYPQWLAELANAGFGELETCSFDVAQPYSHEAWRGRIRASAGIRASLDTAATERFDAELRTMLQTRFKEDPMLVPHRVWWVSGKRPS